MLSQNKSAIPVYVTSGEFCLKLLRFIAKKKLEFQRCGITFRVKIITSDNNKVSREEKKILANRGINTFPTIVINGQPITGFKSIIATLQKLAEHNNQNMRQKFLVNQNDEDLSTIMLNEITRNMKVTRGEHGVSLIKFTENEDEPVGEKNRDTMMDRVHEENRIREQRTNRYGYSDNDNNSTENRYENELSRRSMSRDINNGKNHANNDNNFVNDDPDFIQQYIGNARDGDLDDKILSSLFAK